MVTKFLPLPDNSGGRQRSLAIARRLAEQMELVLCAYDDGTSDIEGLEGMGLTVRSVPWDRSLMSSASGALHTRSVSAGRFYSAALSDEVRRAALDGPVDLLQIEYFQMAFVARGVHAAHSVLDLHNVESALVESYGRSRHGPSALAARVEAAALRASERRIVPMIETVVVVSEKERRRLGAEGSDVLVCPNGWDPSPAPMAPAASPTAAFVASLGWAPNVDAATWFCGSVWPEVVRRLGSARLLLVGRDPAPAVVGLGDHSVEVSGTVPDVRPFLARARIAVAPLRSGGGTRLKILEALDAGRPVVATSVALDGLEDLVGRGVVVADSASSMADAVVELLGDGDAAARLGRAGHEAVEADHSWDRALAPLLAAVTR